MFARSAPVRPAVWRATALEIDGLAERLAAGVHAEDRATTLQIRRLDQDLPVEPSRAKERRVEILEAVRRAHHDDLVARAEPVELDEQLVERLVVLAVERVVAARAADGIELVDEDDRRRILPRLLEQRTDARGTEAGEHLDERRRALREEAGSGLVGDRLRRERLAGPRRAVEEDTFRHARAERLEPLRVAEEVDDLLQLLLRLLEPGDVVPGHRRLRARRDLGRLDARHQLHRLPEEVDDRAHQEEEQDRQPRQREVRHEVEKPLAAIITSVVGSCRNGLKRGDSLIEGCERDAGGAPICDAGRGAGGVEPA